MKYMGHKGRILSAIREQVGRQIEGAGAIADPFCGSGVVAWDLATTYDLPVIAGDLQHFATARAAAVVERTEPLTSTQFVDEWFLRAEELLETQLIGRRLPPDPEIGAGRTGVTAAISAVLRCRRYISENLGAQLTKSKIAWPMTLAYGGYYYSPRQALQLDALRATLPKEPARRSVLLSALIGAASRCAAAPGHTAQPLGLKATSLPHLLAAWRRNVRDYVRSEVALVRDRYARCPGGYVVTGHWKNVLERLSRGDVVFCDPPYSDVQYSRFYHVLETLTRGVPVVVSGSGRNPPFSERPASEFSRRTMAGTELDQLLSLSAERGLRLVVTFPLAQQSNGLSGTHIASRARSFFSRVEVSEARSTFSSLGGNGMEGGRPARLAQVEAVICCR